MSKQFLKKYRPFDAVLLIAALVGVVLFFRGHHHNHIIATSADARNLYTCSASNTANTQQLVVDEAGFRPAALSLNVCDYLTIINAGKKSHEVAFGPHENHLEYPGFDNDTAIKPGGTVTFQLTLPGDYEVHDHLDARLQGSISIAKTPR